MTKEKTVCLAYLSDLWLYLLLASFPHTGWQAVQLEGPHLQLLSWDEKRGLFLKISPANFRGAWEAGLMRNLESHWLSFNSGPGTAT